MLPSFSYVHATSVADAVRRLAAPRTSLHAGGTDLLGCLRDSVFGADRVVSLSRIAALRGISVPATGGLRIGAMTRIAEVASHAGIRQQYAALAQAAASVGSPQIRNQGTLGGNLCQRPRCWYFRGDFHCLRKDGDTCFAVQGENQYHAIFGGNLCYMVHPSDTAPALVALGARVRLTGAGGTRTIPLSSFFVGPDTNTITRETVLQRGEVVTDILLPAVSPGTKSSYRKVRSRGSWDFALCSAAIALTLDGGAVRSARVVLGAVAPVPWRSQAAEKALVGEKLTPETAARAAQAAVQAAEPMEKNGYKVALAKGIIEEQLLALA
jgi:xanthine dehydrogenase YagS FAD-binding subunit